MGLTNKEIIAMEEVAVGLDYVQDLVLTLQRKVETIQNWGALPAGVVQPDKLKRL